MWGRGQRGNNGARFTLLWISIFHSDTHNQTGPLWCWSPSGWACAHSRPLWVSPTTSPARLGVSPTAAPTPAGVFNQGFEALFPRAGALGCAVCFTPHHLSGLSVCECGALGCYPPLCLPRSSHTPPVWVPPRPGESSLPQPVSAPPTGLDECLFFISLMSDFLAVRFSVSSGCARRRSVSTYTANLVLPEEIFMIILSNTIKACDKTEYSFLTHTHTHIIHLVIFLFLFFKKLKKTYWDIKKLPKSINSKIILKLPGFDFVTNFWQVYFGIPRTWY